MKKFLSYSLLAAAAAAGVSLAETATTTPVGYVTQTIAGNPGNSFFGADTYISPTLVQPNVFSGVTSSAPVAGAKVASFAGSSVPTNLDNSYVLEVGNGSREGWWSVVASSTANSITTVSPFPAGLASDVKITVRKIDTLQSFLGENSIGLGPNDQVQILDPITQVTRTAIYTGGEWQDVVTEENIDNEYIYPGSAVKVKIFGAQPKTFVNSGIVKTTKTELDIYPGSNWLPATLAVGGTLGSMNFGNQLIAEDYNPVTTPADTIQIIALNQSASSFIRVDNSIQNIVTEEDASLVPVEGGAGFILKRDGSAPQGTLVIPPQIVGN